MVSACRLTIFAYSTPNSVNNIAYYFIDFIWIDSDYIFLQTSGQN